MGVFFEQLFLVLSLAGIAQGPFVALVLNNKYVRRSRANIFLSVLLLALSFSIAHIFFAGAVIDHLSAKVYSLGDPTFFVIAPLLWFYAREITGDSMKWSWKLVMHFLPFLVIIAFSLTIRSSGFPGLIDLLDQHRGMVRTIFWLALVIQFSLYQFFTRKKWSTYKDMIQQEVSNTENFDITWVRFFLFVFLGINLLFFAGLVAAIHLHNEGWVFRATALIFSLSVFALGYKGVLQKEIFQRGGPVLPAATQPPPAQPDQALIDKLLGYMETKKPYLDPDLTLSHLAKELGVSRSNLSFLINTGIGENFYDFINKYRVEQVKKLMTDPHMKNFNMLGLALEAGFKSKSTFNLIFKRFTGLTPTEYRKNIIS